MRFQIAKGKLRGENGFVVGSPCVGYCGHRCRPGRIFNARLKMPHRFVEPSRLRQQNAEVVFRVGAAGLNGEGLLEALDRAGGVAAFGQRNAEVVLGRGVARRAG